MKKTTMLKIGMATVYGVMGLANQLNGTNAIGGAIGGYLMATVGIAIYNKIKNRKKVDTNKVKEMGANVAVLACKMVVPNMVKYAENKTKIDNGEITPAKTKPYYKGCTYYYKDLADLFYMKNDDMIKVLRKYIIKGEYPNMVLRDDVWGVYKDTRDGERVYIEYTTECIEYLKIILAK